MTTLLILLAVSLAVSAVGWKYFIYFFSLGYGYGIVALAATLLIMYSGSLSWSAVALCAVLILFGCRLGTYLLMRERKAAAYRKLLYDPSLQKKKPLGVILIVKTFCIKQEIVHIGCGRFGAVWRDDDRLAQNGGNSHKQYQQEKGYSLVHRRSLKSSFDGSEE